MTRVQILLTEEQDRELERLAQRIRTSKAKLVREGVDLVLRRKQAVTSEPLLELIGQAGSVGRRDISLHHDQYLLASERRGSR